MEPSPLGALIAASLPTSFLYTIHHVSHAASKSDALYSPPLNTPPVSTTLISHILSVSLKASSLLIYAIEVLIYSTATTTTLFVSKADSTGFLTARSATVSPIRIITTAFLQHLLDTTYDDSKTSHISLFARAQDQYLFPNSIHNKSKHVLSDRQLIRWWARVLDPILQSREETGGAKGYVLVPGLDRYEARSLLPTGWVYGHPYTDDKPVRECIPHFPDDPKSRFMMELEVDGGSGWKGVSTLGSFWELMAFRQECSLGKSVGFISFIVPAAVSRVVGSQETAQSSTPARASTQNSDTITAPPTPRKKKRAVQNLSTYTVAKLLKSPKTFHLKRRAQLRMRKASMVKEASEVLAPSPAEGKVVSKKEYDRLMESLLNSDFGGRKLAEDSSRKWIENVSGEDLPASSIPDTNANTPSSQPTTTTVNMLAPRKRKSDETLPDKVMILKESSSQVNVLQPSMIRKKPKLDDSVEQMELTVNVLTPSTIRKKPKSDENATVEPQVNVLASTIVRKKPKVELEVKQEAEAPVVNVLNVRKKAKAA